MRRSLRSPCAVAGLLALLCAPVLGQEPAPASIEPEEFDGRTRVTTRTSVFEQRDGSGRQGNPFLDEHMTVIEPVVLLEHQMSEDVDASLMLTHDYVSSASISRLDNYPDQSGASGDYYASADGGLDVRVDDRTSVGGTLHGSFERDYISGGLRLRATHELAGGDRLRAGLSGFNDSVYRIYYDGTYNGWAQRLTASVDLGWYRPLTPWLHVEAGYAFSWQAGFLETNFNAVVLEGPGLPPNPLLTRSFPGREVRERLPTTRLRHTGLLRARALVEATGTSLELAARLYGDSWGVTSHALEPALRQWLVRDLLLARVSYRYMLQRAADAWRRHFTAEAYHRTQDPDLGPLEAHALGAGLEWTPTPALGFDIGGELVWRSDGLDQRWLTVGVRYEF